MSTETMAPEEPGAGADPTVEPETEDERVLHWRLAQFNRMGFDSSTAFRLAISGADWHEVEQLLKRGCGLEQAERIAL